MRAVRILGWAAIAAAVFSSFVFGEIPNIINYQGSLATVGGAAVPDGPHQLTFTIYDSYNNILWTSGIRTVQTIGGLFNYELGADVPFPDALFLGNGAAGRYLGITIGSDPEITPRTRLTSTPFASLASRMQGDVDTKKGAFLLKKSDGDSGIMMNASSDKASILMFAPLSEPPKEAMAISVGAANNASIRMFAPQPEPPRVLLEMMTDETNGPRLGMYDNIGQVMGVDPSPFNGGFSINMYAPQAKSAGQTLLSMKTVYDDGNASSLAMSGTTAGSGTIPLVNLSAGSSNGTLNLGPGITPSNTGPLASCLSSETESRLDLRGPSNLGGPTYAMSLITNNSSARVGIGTTTPSQALHVVGNICYTGTIGACSDLRYKKDIGAIHDPIGTLTRLRGITYKWKQQEFPNLQFDGQNHLGFIAQEVRELLPSAVLEDAEGNLSVDYSRLTPLLVEAVKEQQEKIGDLDRQIAELKKIIEEIQAQNR